MNRKEIQKISLQYRTLSSQMLKMNSQEEMYCIQQFFDFISETEIIRNYINECKTQECDFEQIFADKGWRNVLMLPAKEEELVSYGYQLLQYILDGPKSLIGLCMGYTGRNKFSDNIEAFVRKSIEPFVVAIRTYIELCFIDCEDVAENQENIIHHAVSSDVREYTVYYKKMDENTSYKWSIYKVDASTNKILGEVVQLEVRPGQSVEYQVEKEYKDSNGNIYTVDQGMSQVLKHSYGESEHVSYVYYNPKGYTAPKSYTVEVQYKNIVTDETIASQKIEINKTLYPQ